MTTANKSLAFGVIRKGAIPNPSIGRQVARENNPKEILGIFVNPDESKPKAKRGSTMKKKRKTAARPKKKRSAPSRAAAPRRRAKKVSTRSTARARRPRSKNPNLAAGYEARETNARPRKRKATSKRSAPKRRASAKGKMSAAQVRNLLRSVAKRIKNSSSAPRGRTVGQRSGLSASSFGATEIRRAGLLDGAAEIETLDNEIANLQADVTSATDDVLRGFYARELADKIAQRERLLGGLGFLDAAIIGGKSKELKALREGLTEAAQERREQAARRAVASSKFRGIDKRRSDYYAAVALAIVAKELLKAESDREFFPALSKKFQAFDQMGVPQGGRDVEFADLLANNSVLKAPSYETEDGKTLLMMMPKEAIHEAIRMLHRNYLPSAASGAGAARLHSQLAVALDRLHGILEGRIENPRGRKRRSKKRKATRGRKRRRTSNPAPKRRKRRKKSSAASSYKKRSKKRGRRRRNPRGTEMIARLVGGQASIGDMLAVAGAAVGGYVAVGAGEWILQAVGADKMLANLAGNSAQVGSALTAVASGAATALLVWGAGKAVKGVENIEAPLYIGIASRLVVNLIDAFARTPSEATRLLRSAAGLPPTVGSYGRWNPNMDGYYNFQPVMAGAAQRAGYSMGNFANKAGYALQGAAQRAGYSVGGYSNFAPRVNGYSNFAPAVAGYHNFAPKLNQNPFGSAFGKPW